MTDTEQKQDDGPKLGLFSDIPNNEYHRGKGISKSGLDLINRSPAHYIVNKRNPRPATPAMIIGSAFHALVLEPDKFADEYVLDPWNGSQSKEAKLGRMALQADGKMVISDKTGDDEFWQPGDWTRLHRMRDAVMADPLAATFLNPGFGVAEQAAYWIDPTTRKLCKCKPDFINDAYNIAVDLKSTLDASLTGFGKSVANFRYHVQDAFYRDGLRAVGRPVTSFVFVAVEKEPPYAVACYVVEKEAQRVGRIQYQNNLHTFAQCYERDEWPGYPGHENIFEPTLRNLPIAPWGLKGSIS